MKLAVRGIFMQILQMLCSVDGVVPTKNLHCRKTKRENEALRVQKMDCSQMKNSACQNKMLNLIRFRDKKCQNFP